MLTLLLFLLAADNSWSQTNPVLDVRITGSPLSLDQAVGSKNQQDYAIRLELKSHTIKFGIDLGETPIRSNTFYALNYFYNWQLTNLFSNQSGLGLGYLNSSNLLRDAYKFTLEETVLGAANYFRLKLNEKSQLRIGASALRDLQDQANSWDSFKWGANGKIALTLPVVQTWQVDFTTFSQTYNPNRYWFADKRNFLDLRMGPSYFGNGWHGNIFSGAVIDRLNSEPERKIFSGGLTFGLPIFQNDGLELKLIASNEISNQTTSAVLALAWNRPNQIYEIYGLVRNGQVWQQEKSIGLKIQITALGGKKSERKTMPLPEEYREPRQRSQFYSNYGFVDDANLNLQKQTARLNSLRLISEWGGVNLRYRGNGTINYYQTPEEIYKLRSGNCYYQSNLISYMGRQNSYRAYILDYGVPHTKGHQVEIVQDHRTGRWLMYEYGLPQEIRVPANAPIEVVAREAARQGLAFTALPIPNGSEYDYWVGEVTANTINSVLDDQTFSNFQSTAGSQPRVEKGFETFFGPDALWK